MLVGKVPDQSGAVESLLKALGVEALSIVKSAFLVKARKGTDEAGISWSRLDPRYVAYGRRHPGLNRRRAYAAKRGRTSRPLLTVAEDKQWRGIFAGTYRRLRAQGAEDKEAKGNAAAAAWAVLKRQGAKTILSEYGNPDSVEVGRDTGRLFNSLSPGGLDNVLRAGRGAVTVGTNVKYAKHFHAKRAIWPEGEWPGAWVGRLGQTISDGLAVLLRRMVGR
jgi:hypothetical protein